MRTDSARRALPDLYITCEDVPRYLTERGMITPSTADVLRMIARVEGVVGATIHLSQVVPGAYRDTTEGGFNPSDDDPPD